MRLRLRSSIASHLALGTIGWLALAFLLLPLIVVIGVSFTETPYLKFPPQGFTLKWYAQFFHDTSYMDAFWLSVVLATGATLLALLLGIPAGLVIMRRSFPGRQPIAAIFLSPLILPMIVIGVALLQFATVAGFARSFFALLVGHVVVVMPYVMRTTMASLHSFDLSIEEAAQDLGATSAETFFLVTLPQIKPGVVAGGLFAFITSWINVEVSIFHSRQEFLTLPVKLFNYVQFNIDPLIAAASAVTIYFAVLAVIVLDMMIGLEKATSRS